MESLPPGANFLRSKTLWEIGLHIAGNPDTRSAYALAWTKRVANRRLAHHLNLTLDAGAAYEMVNFLQIEKLRGNDRTLE